MTYFFYTLHKLAIAHHGQKAPTPRTFLSKISEVLTTSSSQHTHPPKEIPTVPQRQAVGSNSGAYPKQYSFTHGAILVRRQSNIGSYAEQYCFALEAIKVGSHLLYKQEHHSPYKVDYTCQI